MGIAALEGYEGSNGRTMDVWEKVCSARRIGASRASASTDWRAIACTPADAFIVPRSTRMARSASRSPTRSRPSPSLTTLSQTRSARGGGAACGKTRATRSSSSPSPRRRSRGSARTRARVRCALPAYAGPATLRPRALLTHSCRRSHRGCRLLRLARRRPLRRAQEGCRCSRDRLLVRRRDLPHKR